MNKARQWAKRMLLRGGAGRQWSLRRARQLDASYADHLAAQARESVAACVKAPALVRSGESLDRMLFIGDVLWEEKELFPEIRKLCELRVLDLSSAIKAAAGGELKDAVFGAIKAFAAEAKGYEPDVILFYARPELLAEQSFEALRSRWSCPLFGLNLDDRVEFFPHGVLRSGNDGYSAWVGRFDLNLTSSHAAVDWYRSHGAAVRYLPQGFRLDERFRQPPEPREVTRRFTFVGSMKQERQALVEFLRGRRVEIETFGAGWPDGQWIEDPGEVFRSTQINLGIGYATATGGLSQTKGRDIECPAVGACYLTSYNWELAELFEIGREILCYRNPEELLEMLGYYLCRPEACLRVAQAAHRRCLAEHTWERRLRDLFEELGFRL